MNFKKWKNRKKYDVNVVILQKRGNTLEPLLDKGGFFRIQSKTDSGQIEENYFELYKNNIQFPNPHLIYLNALKSGKYLWVFQADEETYLPMRFEADKIAVSYEVPVVQVDEKGQPLINEKGEYELVRNEKGEVQKSVQERLIFDSTIMLDNGKIVKLPTMVSEKTHDPINFITKGIDMVNVRFRTQSWFQQNMHLVMFFFALVATVVLIKLIFDGFSGIASTIAGSNAVVAEQIRMASDNMVKLAGGTLNSTGGFQPRPPF